VAALSVLAVAAIASRGRWQAIPERREAASRSGSSTVSASTLARFYRDAKLPRGARR